MQITPITARTANHSTMIGPNRAATLAVPRPCMAKSPTRMTIERGTTAFSKAGAMTLRPSTADMTESAGVMAASP